MLNIAPWNAPVLLAVLPCFGAFAAGNCCVLKPADATPHSSALLEKVVRTAFGPKGLYDKAITVVQGDAERTSALLDTGLFDHILFTGGATVGKIVMEKAALTLTPVTLELGGRNPVFVDEMGAGLLESCVKEMVATKIMFSGQFCQCHNTLFVISSMWERFVDALQREIESVGDAARSLRVLNKKSWDRVRRMLEPGGGRTGGLTVVPPLKPDALDEAEEGRIGRTGGRGRGRFHRNLILSRPHGAGAWSPIPHDEPHGPPSSSRIDSCPVIVRSRSEAPSLRRIGAAGNGPHRTRGDLRSVFLCEKGAGHRGRHPRSELVVGTPQGATVVLLLLRRVQSSKCGELEARNEQRKSGDKRGTNARAEQFPRGDSRRGQQRHGRRESLGKARVQDLQSCETCGGAESGRGLRGIQMGAGRDACGEGAAGGGGGRVNFPEMAWYGPW